MKKVPRGAGGTKKRFDRDSRQEPARQDSARQGAHDPARKGSARDISTRPDRVDRNPKNRRSTNINSTRLNSKNVNDDQRRPRFSSVLSVLYEDEAVIVIDKPAGLLAVPIKGSATPSVWSLLADQLEAKKQRALIVHRIDRFSSGALLFAKTAPDRENLVRQFLAHTPVRQYLAALRGRLAPEPRTLVHYFRRDGMYQQLRTAKDPEATRAEMRYSVERLFANASLVRVELVTGLQNQIRVQFSALGHPVIGDRKYHRSESSEPLIARVALHAAHLEFIHPRTGKNISIDCKLPPDFQHLVRELSRSSVAAPVTPTTKQAAPAAAVHVPRARRNPKAPRRRE
jgi:23S rRNA pseudouridine1911/1915/1917 synthase